MSQSEALRLSAEVVDGFSGPLKNLRQQLQSLSKEGGVHADTLAKGFSKVEAGARQAERTVSTALNPALATIGVTGLTATAAIGGIVSAMRSFATSAAGLGALSRETGQTADNLRTLGAVASKFGLDQDAVASGTKNFAAQMREFGRGIGETYQWLNRQGRDGAERKHFQDFAADLRKTTDRGEQLRKVIAELENIKDPTERAMFAEKFFGNGDFGKLGDEHLGKIKDVWDKTVKKLGPLDPKAVESAEQFERAMADLRSSMAKLGTTIGQELLPYATRFTTWLDDIVANQRGDIMKALKEGLAEIRKELDGIDWKQAGEDAKGFLTGTVDFAKDLVTVLKSVATLLSAVKDLKDGNFAEAFKKLGQADRATDLGLGQGRAPGTIQDSMRADTGPLMLKQAEIQKQIQILDENIGRKESQPDPMGEGHIVATEERAKRDRLIEETKKLGDEIKRLREDQTQKKIGDATVSKSSFGDGTGGEGGGLGGLIQKASFGTGGGLGGLGGGGVGAAAALGRRLGGGGGGDGGGGLGGGGGGNPGHTVDGSRSWRNNNPGNLKFGPYAEKMGATGKDDAGFAKFPSYDAGRKAQENLLFNSDAYKNLSIRDAIAKWAPGSDGNDPAGYAAQMAKATGTSADTKLSDLTPEQRGKFLDAQQRKEGWIPGVGAGDTTSGPVRANLMHGQFGQPGENLTTLRTKSGRSAQVNAASAPSFSGFIGELESQGYNIRDFGGFNNRDIVGARGRKSQHAYGNAIDLNPGKNPLGTSITDMPENVRALAKKYGLIWGMDWKGRKDPMHFEWNGTRPWLDDKNKVAEEIRKRQADEEAGKKKLELGKGAQKSIQNGAGAGKVEANGKVQVHIETTDPAAKAKSSTEGKLFRDVEHSRGRQMAPSMTI